MHYCFDGKGIKFAKIKIEYKFGDRDVTRYCYDQRDIDLLITTLKAKKVQYTITEVEQPSSELLARCDGKVFNNYEDVKSFINGTLPKPEIEILQELVDELIIDSLKGWVI